MFKQFYADCNQRFNDWKSAPVNYAKNNVYIAASGQGKSFFYKDNQHEYMPEFFLGNPDCCSAVILNLNPGIADLGFHYKDSRFNNYNYSAEAQKFPLGDSGRIWWFGANGKKGRNAWINNLIGNDNWDLKPFALEICPLHSKSWGGLDYSNNNLQEEIAKYVFDPAFKAVSNSKADFAIAIGKDFVKILSDPFFGFKERLVWDQGNHPQNMAWPKNKKGNPTDRTLVLLEKENNRVFCTYAPGSNRPPGKNFREIEHLFVEEIKKWCKTGK
ncbi:MAG: hypothetical protein J6R36_06860 [Bacteroidaceae bacterium]|nr:hypothetical protein [Bacteroidaceae bacterium]